MKRTIKSIVSALLVFALLLIPNSQSFAAAKPTINLTNVPGTLSQGHSFDLRGTVSGSAKITLFKGEIIPQNGGNTKSVSYNPNSKSVDIHSSKVNNLKFGELDPGSYVLRLTAKDANGNSTSKSYSFTVKASASTLSISMTQYPSGTLKYQNSFNLIGTVSSNYNITKIKGRVIYTDTEINALDDVTYSPNKKSVQIKDTVINKILKFGKLEPGKYTLIIYAWDASGEPFREKRYPFTVAK